MIGALFTVGVLVGSAYLVKKYVIRDSPISFTTGTFVGQTVDVKIGSIMVEKVRITKMEGSFREGIIIRNGQKVSFFENDILRNSITVK
jgi:hypothetical protein